MVLVCENIHPRGLDFQNQRKVVILRDVQGLSFVDIAAQVKNLAGKQPSPRTCCQYYKQFSVSRGRKKNCLQQLWPSALEADNSHARICVALLAKDEEARDVHHKVFAS